MRKITKTIKLKDLFYISEERLNDEIKKSSQIILVFMIRLGKKNDYFLRWENF